MDKVRLDELVEQQISKIVTNKNPKIPYIGLEHIAQGEPRLLGAASSTSSSSVNSVFSKDDILFGKLRPNLKKSIRAPFDGYCSTDILVLRSRNGVLPSFTGHVFQWERVFAAAVATAAGTKMPRTAWSDLRLFRVCKPSTEADQARIAYVLDTIDEAIQKTESVIAKLKQIRAGMLHDLLTYGLDKDGKLRDPIAHPDQFKDSELGRIPKEWEVVAVQDICNTYAGGTPSRSVPGFFGGGIPWVKSTEANRDAITETEETISIQGYNASSVKWIPAGVPLMAMYGATAGQVTWLAIRATSNQAVLAMVPSNESVEARCFYWILRRETPKIVLQATGSGQPNLSKALIDKWRIAFPNEPSEQRAIAIALDQAVKREATEHAHAQTLRSIKSGLMDDLLTGNVSVPADLLPEEVPA